MIAWTLFYHPVTLPASWALWMVLPVLLAVAVVYKTLRTENLRRLPLEIAALMGYMVGGLVVLGVGLWLVQACFL